MSATPGLRATSETGRWVRRPTIYGALFLFVAGSAIAFLATRLGVDASGVWQYVRQANPGLFLAAVVLFYLGLAVRGLRWRVIMENASTGASAASNIPGRFECMQFVLIARFVDSVTWFRFGNMYRAYLVSPGHPARIPHVFGTILSEHVLDAVAVLTAVLAVGAYVVVRGIDIPIVEPALAGVGSVGLIALGLLAMRRYGVKLARRLPRHIARLYLRLHRGVIDGLGARRLPLLLLLSVLGWFLAVGRWYLIVAAIGASVSFPLVLLLSITNVLIASIPITPGGLGLIEPGATAVLSLEVPVEMAVAGALAERAISYVSVVVFGAALFFGREVVKRTRTRDSRWS